MGDRWMIAGAAAAFLAVSVPAMAEVSGLVLEVKGKTEPQLAPFSEITTDETITVAPDATLKVVHYKSCRTVALSGGTIQAGEADFKVTGGAVASNVVGRCPPRMGTKTGSGLGGIVMRGGEVQMMAVSPGQVFVLAGDGASKVNEVRLTRDDKTISVWKPDGKRSWRLPDGALQVGDTAVLEIQAKGAEPVKQNVMMMKPLGNDAASKLMVIELE